MVSKCVCDLLCSKCVAHVLGTNIFDDTWKRKGRWFSTACKPWYSAQLRNVCDCKGDSTRGLAEIQHGAVLRNWEKRCMLRWLAACELVGWILHSESPGCFAWGMKCVISCSCETCRLRIKHVTFALIYLTVGSTFCLLQCWAHFRVHAVLVRAGIWLWKHIFRCYLLKDLRALKRVG